MRAEARGEWKMGVMRLRRYTRQNWQGIVGVRLVCFCWNRLAGVV